MLQEYIQQNRISITKEKTQEILQVLGNEPDNHYEWSEQDLYEHLRKLIKKQSNFLFTSPSDAQVEHCKYALIFLYLNQQQSYRSKSFP